jgi:H+-translocating NAD(P) transhydrogenase subunit alpha
MSDALITGIVIFTLATFLGAELIGRVPPTLHTPLMSGANAISGITIAGALVVAGAGYGWISTILGFLAIVFAMINVVGGYAVTDRMLAMFRRKEDPAPAARPTEREARS